VIRVGVVGATGYTGEELLRLLSQHPQVAVTSVSASAKMEHPMAIAELYPRFGGRLKLFCTSLNVNDVASASDLVFLALPGPGTFALLTSTSKGGFRAGAAATLGLILGDQLLLWSAVAGIAALLAMLNSCSPGIATVNIDNGFGAGYFASLVNK